MHRNTLRQWFKPFGQEDPLTYFLDYCLRLLIRATLLRGAGFPEVSVAPIVPPQVATAQFGNPWHTLPNGSESLGANTSYKARLGKSQGFHPATIIQDLGAPIPSPK